MDWVPALISAIGSVRLILIFSGILMLSRSIVKSQSLPEHQKQCFAISGIIYLLGLIPQSLLLLFTNSDTVNYLLDSGYLCWVQKFACIIAVSIHALIFFSWITSIIWYYYEISDICPKAFVKRKGFFHVLVVYVMLLVLCRVFFLKIDDSRKFYMDVASRTENDSFNGWTISSVENPAQVVRLQLLLCESSLSPNDMKYFLTMCYLLLFLPLALVFFILKPLFNQVQQSSDANMICHSHSVEGWQHQSWWERDVNVQKILSASVTLWYFAIQPAVFALQRQHFVDFGTHLLLTICVFVPWALPSPEQKSTLSWV